MQLNKIKDNIYYIDGPVNLGVVTNDTDALLIDTGIDDSVSRKAKRLLETAGLQLTTIIISHAHADHYGGAAYLAKTTGAKVYAPRGEKSIIESPILEPVYLFGGAYPPAALRNKFLYAPRVDVDDILVPGLNQIGKFEFEVVDLKGHSLEQIGIAANGVIFCADAVIGPDVLQKHRIPLNADIENTLACYTTLETRQEDMYVLCHGSITDNIKPVVRQNREVVNNLLLTVLSIAETPHTIEEIVASACKSADLTITNTGQHCLMTLTIMAYISYLLDQNQLSVCYEENRQIIKRME